MLADQLDLVAAPFRPAHIHALQHLRPVLAFGAAGAGVDLDIGVVGVRLAGQQRLHLAGMGLLPQLAQRRFRLGDDALVALLLAESDKREIVVEFAGEAVECVERRLDLLALAHQALRAARVVPEVGGFRLAVELGQPRLCLVGVKDASVARTGTL